MIYYQISDIVSDINSIPNSQNIRGIQMSVDGRPIGEHEETPQAPHITFEEWFLKAKQHNDAFYPDDIEHEYYYKYIYSDLVEGCTPPYKMVVVKIKR